MIYIVRHGQTDLNNAHALQGRSDHPLNETGVRQAQEAARLLELRGVSFSRAYASPLARAVQTARIIAPGAPLTTDDRLIEMDYGPYEGMDLRTPSPEIIRFFSDFVHNPAPEGMEQLDEVVTRVGGFVDELRGLTGDILVSTHAIAMKAILEYLTPDSRGSFWSKYLGNCAVYTVEAQGGCLGTPQELVGAQGGQSGER